MAICGHGGGASHFFLVLVLLLIGCEPTQRSATTPVPPPQIAFATRVHDFGEIEQGAKIDYAFTFSNRGAVDLTIDRTRAGCGCEAVVDVEHVVPPGGTAHLRVRCDTKTSFGQQRRTVSVYSNDPVTPVAVVRLVGKVRADTTLSPSPFYVGRVRRGERVRRDGTARWAESQEPLDIVADPNAAFRVEMAAVTPGSDRVSFTLVMKDDAPLGPIVGRVQLQTVTAGVVRTVPVVGEVVADSTSSPSARGVR